MKIRSVAAALAPVTFLLVSHPTLASAAPLPRLSRLRGHHRGYVAPRRHPWHVAPVT